MNDLSTQRCVGKIAALLQALVLNVGSWGLRMCYNVGGVSFFFFCMGRKNKIIWLRLAPLRSGSIKFALSCQKAKSFLSLIIYHYRFCLVVCLLHLPPTIIINNYV